MNPISAKFTVGFRILLAASILAITYLTLSKPTGNVHGLINDKVAHGLSFFLLTFIMDMAFPRMQMWGKVLILFAYGLGIELLQLQLAYRHFSWWDWLADIVGVLLYLPLLKPVHQLVARVFPA